MPTTNKGLNQPVLGSTGWGTPLNENATILDLALGAFEIVAGTSGTVTLSTIQVQSMCLKSVTAAFSADVTYVVPSGVAGQWLVTNQSAASAFSVIVKNAASATSVSVPNGQSRLVYSDGTKVIYSVDQTIATQAQAEAKTDNSALMTPLRTSQQVQSTIASQAQAIAGTDNTTLMTPLRTAQAAGVDYQVFTASGTWTKPTNAPANAMVTVQIWGAGGSGAYATTGGISTNRQGTGGGGGAYTELRVSASSFGSTVAVSVGAGGAGRGSFSNGLNGGNSSFGSYLVYGGQGGPVGNQNGLGAGFFGIGNFVQPVGTDPSQRGMWEGSSSGPTYNGAFSLPAVFGGGAGSSHGDNIASGSTSLYGGNGGLTAGSAGSAPAGGGSGNQNAASGSGARGEIRVWTQW